MDKISSISFFCPAYNDQDNLPKLIPKVHSFLSKISHVFEIIIVHDGSPDRTGQVADKLADEFSQVRVIHHEKNMGYGATLRDGFLAGKYDYVMYTDGDNQYDVNEFEPYVHLLKTHDILSGYAPIKVVTFRRKFQSWAYNTIIKLLFFVNIKDIDCAMKVYSRRFLDEITIQSTSAFIDAEMLIKAKRGKFKIAQFPVTQYPRLSGPEGGVRRDVILDTIKEKIKFRLGLLR